MIRFYSEEQLHILYDKYNKKYLESTTKKEKYFYRNKIISIKNQIKHLKRMEHLQNQIDEIKKDTKKINPNIKVIIKRIH